MTANWKTRGGELLHVEVTGGHELTKAMIEEQRMTWLGWTATCVRCMQIGTAECCRERNREEQAKTA